MTVHFSEQFSTEERDLGDIFDEEVCALPTSFSQQRLWFFSQFEPGNPFYNIPAAVLLKGSLNVETLKRSFQEIVRRHEALRTTFGTVDGKPVQVIHPTLNFALPVTDLRELPPAKREAEVQKLTAAAALQHFNLAKGPLLRANLLHLDSEEYILLLTLHHIVFDGWSIGVLLQELAALYEAFLMGKPSPLPELPIQYADFAIWQREWLAGDRARIDLAYWKQQLEGAPPLLELPTDRPRPPVQTYRGAKHSFLLSKALTEALNSLSRKENVTLFMTLLAAFKTLLYRYTGQADIVVGAPIANRNQAEIQGLIGFFVNTLVLRTDLSDTPTFRALLARIREVTLEAYAHQELPLEQLMEELQPQRDLSYNPLFQVSLVLQNAPLPIQHLPGMTLTVLEVDNQTSKFDLTVNLEEKSDGISANFEYSTDLFDAATIGRMAGHFQRLLEEIAANPDRSIEELPLLTENERYQLLIEWNDAPVDYPRDRCIHQLFEAQVDRTPDAIAVVFEDQKLTYRELNERANQLAHYLQKLGVKPEVLVGICVERSLEMAIGILAILKAGGAYVPLAPGYPPERLAFMLKDAQTPVLLTQKHLVEKLPLVGTSAICLDADWQAIARQSEENLTVAVTAENLAYVIYTSGSTGKPKGAANTHRGICNRLLWMQDAYELTESDRVLQKTPFSFDVSVWELFWPLLTGARLIIARPEGHRDSFYLVELIARQQITTLHFVPSMLQLFLEEPRLDFCHSLKRVITSGEALSFELQERFFNRLNAQLHNLYGPTEAAVDVSFWACTRQRYPGIVPIGRPIANTQLYILDRYLQPVPIGVPGELHIGGAGLARGYLNRPELTAQKFIPNPFSNSPDARLYKTGDRARYLPDGNIEYLGRIDNQVKIRGYRIELGEIEAQLNRHPAVRESSVLLREDAPGDKRLIAYIVAASETTLTTGELHVFLKEKLPDYMVPAAFVLLEALPLTINGKLDRRSLPEPDTARPDLAFDFVAPGTAEEKALAEIWEKILGVEKVGIRDNFFALGGDSIRSIQVQSLAQKQGLRFSLQQLFQYQTIEAIVRELKATEFKELEPSKSQAFSLILPADKQQIPDNVEDAYPLTALQMGMIFHSEYSPESAIYHYIFSFHLKAPLEVQVLQAAIEYLVKRHAVLRTSFQLTGFSQPLQLVHQKVEVPLQVEDWRHLSNSQREAALNAWLEGERNRHFDWKNPPLMRFQIHRYTQETFQLTFVFHHAILDGWSVGLLLTELFQQYFLLLGKTGGSAAVLPQSAFRDFVALERASVASEEHQRFWKEKLSDSTIAVLPRWQKFPREARIRQICIHNVAIPPEISEGLKQLANSAGVPLKSVLLAAHLRVLSRLCGQSDVVTGLVANGRPEETDGERICGLFLNTLPFRLELSGGTWIDLVQQVFEAERELLPYRRYPLAEIQRNLGGQPLFETAFNYVNFHVYQGLQTIKNLEVLGEKFLAETNFPLFFEFSLDPFSAKVQLSLEYDSAEFCSEQVEAMGGYYARILEAIARESSERYELRSLLSEREQRQLLVEWNDTRADYPSDRCIHQLFEAQVERTPDAIAVVFEDQELTYRELNTRANQVAHYLQKLGVKPEVLVGICTERSLLMVVGILGILKAGGAYIPLAPDYPQERLAYMLEDARAPLLLTQQHLLNKLPPHSCTVVCLDADWEQVALESEENPSNTATPENLAYVTYTSGSTGRPKGVAVNRSSLVNAYLGWEIAYGLRSGVTSHLQMASFSFDVFSGDLMRSLCSGGKLVLCDRDLLLVPQKLYELMRQQKIDVAEFVPAVLRNLIQYLEESGQRLDFMKILVCGSDSWYASEYEKFRQFCGPETRLINSFGITEATIDSCYFESATGNLAGEQLVPIGRPFANTQLYILDTSLQPVPIGVPGELHVGGAGLARGYLNRPELTAEKFIANPFCEEISSFGPSNRLYKTGDLGRYLPDGNIELIGRIDNQVKIRGFRIELAEIEAVLSQHPAVRESAVLVWEEANPRKRLVAYVVPDAREQNSSLSSSELRQFLQERLPEYMVPSAFVLLEKLPLTPNGKLDRRALPQKCDRVFEETAFTEPQTPTEKELAQIWMAVLELEKVGINESFFAIGGHSLMAMQLVSRVRMRFGVELALYDFFAAPTIQKLAEMVEEEILANADSNQIDELLALLENIEGEEAQPVMLTE